MFKHFISLQWKAFFRSASVGKSVGLKILLAFLAVYFGLAFLSLGIGAYPLLQELYPGQDPVQMANRFILIWLCLELFMRFMLQTLPVIAIKPLLLLPVPKRKVVNYVLIKSLFSFYNLLPLFLIVPFGIYAMVKSGYSNLAMLAWMISVYSLILCVNYLNFLLNKKFTENLKQLLTFLIPIAILVALEYFDIFKITLLFGHALDLVLQNPYLVVVPAALLFGIYKWNQLNLENKFYLDASLAGKVTQANTRNFQWTRKFGDIAPFLQLDLKLIWRNKRPKTTVFLSFLFMLYGLIFYPNDMFSNLPFMFVFVGIFITGIFMINFGQFIPAWDSPYYSMMMAQNIPLKNYLASKSGLMIFSVLVLTVLTTPYVYFGVDILILNLACAAYNIGINVPVLLYAGSFNRKRIDLEKSPFLNYQGTGAAQWIVALPLLVVPILVFLPFNLLLSYNAGIMALMVLGLLGILFRPQLMNFIEKAYQKNKYAMIKGFQQTGE